MSRVVWVSLALLLSRACIGAAAQSADGEQRFRELYKELVETNTAFSSGSCALAAERMAARLRTAGFSDQQLHLFAPPGHEREGGLVAVYPGRDDNLKALLLLAHID